MRKYLDSIVIYDTNNMTKKEWLLARKSGIGGSDAASVVGLNQYKSSVSVYIDKISEEVKEELNYRMELGQKLEDFVAKEFALITGKDVRNVNGILENHKYPFAIANIDKAIVGEKAFLECKVTNSYSKKEWKEQAPIHYQIQCFHYMAVTGATSLIKDLEIEKKAIEQHIQNEMKEYEIAYIGDKKITWKNQSRSSLDTKRLKKEHPEIVNEYMKTTTSRVFRI